MSVWPLSAFADEAAPEITNQIKALQRANIRFLDPRNVDGHNICELPLDVAKEAAAKLNEAGIVVQMYGSPIGKIDIADDFDIDVQKLEHLSKLKPIFNCSSVRLFSYFNKQNASKEDWQAESIRRLIELTKLAKKLGLVLYHENEKHIFGDLCKDVCTIRDEVHAKHGDDFKMIFDFDNYNQSGENVWENWLALRDSTQAIHLKDSKRTESGYSHVPAGEGDGRIPEILADAASRGWVGPLTLEPHLSNSKAVAATGPSGQRNEALKDMPKTETFQLAAEAARALLTKVDRW